MNHNMTVSGLYRDLGDMAPEAIAHINADRCAFDLYLERQGVADPSVHSREYYYWDTDEEIQCREDLDLEVAEAIQAIDRACKEGGWEPLTAAQVRAVIDALEVQ